MMTRLKDTFFLCTDISFTKFYTLSLHDALPISLSAAYGAGAPPDSPRRGVLLSRSGTGDRKSTRLNSSHLGNSYAVFCLKKKKHASHRATVIEWLLTIISQIAKYKTQPHATLWR